jgi:hypothetical protein
MKTYKPKRNQEQKDTIDLEEERTPQIDPDRPNFTIGYQKGTNDAIAIQKNHTGPATELEVAVILTHAQAVNTLALLNKIRKGNELIKEKIEKQKHQEQEGKKDGTTES